MSSVCLCVFVCAHVCLCEREREREEERESETSKVSLWDSLDLKNGDGPRQRLH